MGNWKFMYGGQVFIPYRRLTGNEVMHDDPIRHTMHDPALGLMRSTYADCKTPYNYEDFYRASPAKDCDLFLCQSNGLLYIPGENELYRWVGYRGLPDKAYTELKPRKNEYVR